MSIRDRIMGKLQADLAPSDIDLRDESHRHAGHAAARPDGETHFHVRLTSSRFTGMSRLERHRLVHTILKDELSGPVHALSIEAKAPGEKVP